MRNFLTRINFNNHFDIDPEARQMLLEGLDVIALTLKSRAAINAWEATDRTQRQAIAATRAAPSIQ